MAVEPRLFRSRVNSISPSVAATPTMFAMVSQPKTIRRQNLSHAVTDVDPAAVDELTIWPLAVTCGMPKDKCESLFGECMEKYCADNAGAKMAECKQNAGMYTMGTTMMGGGAFKDSRDEACDCVPPEKLKERQREELTAFYEKWAPSQIHKVDTLLEKYGENFPRLMMMMGQKYRDSIKIIKKDEKMVQAPGVLEGDGSEKRPKVKGPSEDREILGEKGDAKPSQEEAEAAADEMREKSTRDKNEGGEEEQEL